MQSKNPHQSNFKLIALISFLILLANAHSYSYPPALLQRGTSPKPKSKSILVILFAELMCATSAGVFNDGVNSLVIIKPTINDCHPIDGPGDVGTRSATFYKFPQISTCTLYLYSDDNCSSTNVVNFANSPGGCISAPLVGEADPIMPVQSFSVYC